MANYNEANKRIAKNSIFLSVRMLFVLGISLYTTRAVLQILGVVDFGVYNVVCGFVSLFTFINTSMSNGIQRFYNIELGKNGIEGANRVYCISVQIQLLLAIIVVILTETIGLWYLYNKMVIPEDRMFAAGWIFQLSMLTFFFSIMRSPYNAAITAHEKMDFYAIVSIIEAIMKLGIVFMIPHLKGDQLIWYGVLMAGITLLSFTATYFYCRINFAEIRLRYYSNKQLFRSMLSFSGWNLFGSFSGIMKEQGINLVINLFFGPVVNAARGVAAQVNNGIQGFVGNILTPVRPQVMQSYARGEINRTLNLTYSVSKFSSCFFLMMAIPASLEIDYVLRLWLGNNVPEHTNLFTILVLMTTLVNILNGATSTVVHATGVMKDYQLWGSIIGIASVPVAYIILQFNQMPELALVTVLVCTIIGHIIGLFIVRKLVGMSIRIYIQKVLWPIFLVFVSSIITVLPVRFIFEEGIQRLICVVLLCVLSVILSTYLLVMDKTERIMVIHFWDSFISKIKK